MVCIKQDNEKTLYSNCQLLSFKNTNENKQLMTGLVTP